MAGLVSEPILIRDARQRERLEALYHLAVELSALRDLQPVLNTALRHCLALTESRFGFIGLTTPDGRFTIMMPHPERTFLKWQWPWMPAQISESTRNFSPAVLVLMALCILLNLRQKISSGCVQRRAGFQTCTFCKQRWESAAARQSSTFPTHSMWIIALIRLTTPRGGSCKSKWWRSTITSNPVSALT